MAYHVLEPGDEEFLEDCPKDDGGYMVPMLGRWYQCSECGLEAQRDEESGLLLFDADIDF